LSKGHNSLKKTKEKKMRKINQIGIAVILFVALLSTSFTFAQMHRGGMMQGNHHKMMMEKLNLTDSQKEAVEDLHFSHKREMIDLKADLEKKELDMQELLSKGNYTRDDYLAKVKAISSAKEKMALVKANHRMDVYDLLTEEQRKTFNEMKGHMGNKMKMKKMKHRKMMDKS
jgi:Spy/CpxP family protein refolding chaperone